MVLTEDQFNENWFVQDGFLVSKKERKIANINSPSFQERHKNVCRYIEANYQEPFQDFDNLRSDSRNAFPLASSEMFQYVDTVAVWIQLVENQGEKYFRRLPQHTTSNTFEATAHIIRLHTRYDCCVYVPTSVTEDDVPLHTMDESLRIPFKEEDFSYFNRSMCLNEYKWRQADVDTLTELLKNSASIWHDLVMILKHLNQNLKTDYHVQTNAASFTLPNKDMVVRSLSEYTLRVYSSHLLPFYVALLNLGRFKCFEGALAEYKQAYPDFTLGCLLDDFGDPEMLQAKAEKLNEMFSKFYSNTECVAKLIRELIAFSFFKKKPDGTMGVISTYRALKILDGLKTLFKYSMAYTWEGYDLLLETMVYTHPGKRPPIINHIEDCYHHILQDNSQEARHFCEGHIESKSCTIKNVLIKASDLTSTYATMAWCYHRVLEDLSRHDERKGNSIHMTWKKLMAAKRGKPDRADGSSFLEQFDVTVMKRLQMRIPRTVIEQQKSRLVGMLNKLSKTLQVLVWISVGMNLRYPELSSLSFSGSQRNVFYHDGRKRIVVTTMCRKNQKYEKRISFLNEEVSKIVVHYAVVLKNLYFILFEDENGKPVMPPLAENPTDGTAEYPTEDTSFGYSQKDEEEEDAQIDAEQSARFYYSMLFINYPEDVERRANLTATTVFTSWMQRYMPGETRIPLAVLRQAAVVFSRMAISQANTDVDHLALVTETSFGRSVATGEADDGVSGAKSLSDSSGFHFMRSQSWHKFLDIEKPSLEFYESLDTVRLQVQSDKDGKTKETVNSIPRLLRDLEEAGHHIDKDELFGSSADCGGDTCMTSVVDCESDREAEVVTEPEVEEVFIPLVLGRGRKAGEDVEVIDLTMESDEDDDKSEVLLRRSKRARRGKRIRLS